MIRFLVYLAIVIALAWFATTVQLGKHTLVGHIRAIWHTEEVRDLKDGVKDKARPAVQRLERGIHAATGSEHQAQAHGSDAEAPQ
jgi:phosphoenolpyruvate carboxylase